MPTAEFQNDKAYSFHEFNCREFKRLLPDFGQFEAERYDMPNLKAMNFYIKGVLGTGAASNHRIDKQAKSLGEYSRAKYIDVPDTIINTKSKADEKTA